MTPFVPLREADSACGPKAKTLGHLLRAGFAVPDGVVLPVGSPAGWERHLPASLEALGATQFAVRSSAIVEDGTRSSYAGQFRTSLKVPRARVEHEIRRVAAAVEDAQTYAAVVGE